MIIDITPDMQSSIIAIAPSLIIPHANFLDNRSIIDAPNVQVTVISENPYFAKVIRGRRSVNIFTGAHRPLVKYLLNKRFFIIYTSLFFIPVVYHKIVVLVKRKCAFL